ncbi:XRE family transcriptional regulator [bacterium]|nr:XRE family transcriptional regulator [bacterium]
MKPCYKLKVDEIQRLIAAQDLKKYWVAEVAGVHKTTLRRWLKGSIQKVKESHLQKLAQVLTTEPARIGEFSP